MITMLNFIKKLKDNEDITIEFVGDSVTHGLNHCRLEETYVAKFALLIAKKFENYTVCRYDGVVADELSPMKSFDGPILVSYKDKAGKIDIIKNGIGGNTVQRALNRIGDFTGTLANGKSPDIIFMMFGINDALKSDSKKYVTAEQFEAAMTKSVVTWKCTRTGTTVRNDFTFTLEDGTVLTYWSVATDIKVEKNLSLALATEFAKYKITNLVIEQ